MLDYGYCGGQILSEKRQRPLRSFYVLLPDVGGDVIVSLLRGHLQSCMHRISAIFFLYMLPEIIKFTLEIQLDHTYLCIMVQIVLEKSLNKYMH